MAASEPGNNIAGQRCRGSQGGRQLVKAQHIPAFRQSPGLQLPNDPKSAQLDLPLRPRTTTRLPNAARASIP